MRRILRILLLAGLTLSLVVGLPSTTAKYITPVTAVPVVAVWSKPVTVNANGTFGPQECSAVLNVTEGENEGWYAFVIWGACGGTGRQYPGDNYGSGGSVRGVAYFSQGDYLLVAGARGANAMNGSGGWYSEGSSPGVPVDGAYYGGGTGYFNNIVGGSGGGLSGIFNASNINSIQPSNAIAVAGGGGGGGAHSPLSTGDWTNHGGHGAGYINSGVSLLGEPPWGGTPDDRNGGSSREENWPPPYTTGSGVTNHAGSPNWERGAGGGITHPINSGYGTTVAVVSGGGLSDNIYVNSPGRSLAGEYRGMHGGSWVWAFDPATPDDPAIAVGGGGGGGGYYGGGAGGMVGNNYGGGGGGASYIKESNGGKASLTFKGNFAVPSNDSRRLDGKIVTYLDGLQLTNPGGQYSGMVQLVYLGPSDNIFTGDVVTNW